jgi:hypothetical protein
MRLLLKYCIALAVSGVALTPGRALADIAPPDACHTAGSACDNAGPAYNEPGTCAPAKCAHASEDGGTTLTDCFQCMPSTGSGGGAGAGSAGMGGAAEDAGGGSGKKGVGGSATAGAGVGGSASGGRAGGGSAGGNHASAGVSAVGGTGATGGSAAAAGNPNGATGGSLVVDTNCVPPNTCGLGGAPGAAGTANGHAGAAGKARPAPPAKDDGGCGCRLSPLGTERSVAGAMLLVGLAALRRSRRRRS